MQILKNADFFISDVDHEHRILKFFIFFLYKNYLNRVYTCI